jgi:hypothetical protein
VADATQRTITNCHFATWAVRDVCMVLFLENTQKSGREPRHHFGCPWPERHRMADKPKVENRRSAKEAESHGPAMSRAGSTALMHGFTVTARELGKLHVHGDPAGCKEALERLGGVKGLATKLCTSLLTGLPEGEEEVPHRQEAYVASRRIVSCRIFDATGVPTVVADGLLPLLLLLLAATAPTSSRSRRSRASGRSSSSRSRIPS